MILQIKLSIPSSAFLKDPQDTKLGISIIQNSIELIDEIGFEAFTFKKLAAKTESTEATIYRYFENKHQLLLYIYSWYWVWMEYKITSETSALSSPKEKLITGITMLIARFQEDSKFPFVNEVKLRQIIEQEGIKSILTKKVDIVNKVGVFANYKNLVSILSNWILEINPQYVYPNMLITTVIEGAHLQHYFSDHLPRLTSNTEAEDSAKEFFLEMIEKLIKVN
jgi:AcrR family transcriptional regulator